MSSLRPLLVSVTVRELDESCPRERFACGERLIDDWFRAKALKRQRRQAVRVRTAHLTGNREAAGFYAISICSHPVTDLANEQRAGWETQLFPATYLAYLAVQQRLQGRGIGRHLLMHAIDTTNEVAKHVGIHGLVLTALDRARVPFYEKLGFGCIGRDCASPTMLLPIDSIRDLTSEAGED